MRSILDFSDEESADFMNVLIEIRKAMSDVLGIKDVYYFQNEDTPYGFHFWLLPYYDWMSKVSSRGPGLPISIWKYAKNNMLSDEDIFRTREAANKMREFLNK